MLYRVSALAVALFWAAMMSWLLYHDVWPAWTAQDPPRGVLTDTTGPGNGESQAGIYDARGNRLGTAWTTSDTIGAMISREDTIWIYRFPGLPPTRIDVDTTLSGDGQLQEIEVHVLGHEIPIVLQGERFAGQFAFRLSAGPRDLKFKIPESQTGMMGQMFRPFTRLGDLRVGQSWRMQVFNPFAAVSGFGAPFVPLLVRVTGRSTVMRDGASVDCFVVETAGSRALVGPGGVVYDQEVHLPVGGVIHIRDEPFDEDARTRTKAARSPPFVEAEHGR